MWDTVNTMPTALWIAAAIMAIVAFAFLVRPLFRTGHHKTIIALALVVPVVSSALYLLMGSPQADGDTQKAHITTPVVTPAAAPENDGKVASVSSMVDGLARRLEENPEDGKGWLLLAKSYQHLGREKQAAAAYAQAAALGQHDAELAAMQADTGAELTPAASVSGRVSLSSEAAKLVRPSDTVFIFARGADRAGPPLAALQRSAADLPFEFTLSDTHAMMAGRKLSDADEVVVTARISRSGNAIETLQGLEATASAVSVTGDSRVVLTIE